jgi:hypothetical protein
LRTYFWINLIIAGEEKLADKFMSPKVSKRVAVIYKYDIKNIYSERTYKILFLKG